MVDEIIIDIAVPEDARAIREVSARSWIATFPNAEYGITREDLIARFTFVSESAEEKYHRERMQTIKNDRTSQYWVARFNSDVIGYCMAKKGEDRNCLQILHVLPEHHGKGIGKRLMEKAMDWLGGEKDIEVGTTVYNKKAIAFYESFGFRSTGRIYHSEVSRLPSGASMPQIEMIKSRYVDPDTV